MSDRLEIRLLGPFEVLADGRPAEVSGSKRHALLAMLALRPGRVVEVDALVDALWGEDLPAAPRNAVQHHVTRLRAALGRDSIAGSPNGYALQASTVDSLRFEELLAETRAALRGADVRSAADSVASALSLWRGAALQGLTETAWFSAEARRLEALRVDALEERFEVALALGEHREVTPALRAALEESPFRERLWGQLMLALYRGGRQADALETFQEARRALDEELGLEPGPELRRLQEAILAHDPSIAPLPVAPRRRGNLPASPSSFVGRRDELVQVVELLREHRLVTLTGPPGVGKSRLALEATRAYEAELRDGAWLVDLARAGSPADIARLVAQAVEVRGSDSLANVATRLRDTEAMLVLDACEHVIGEAARVASTLLAECPGVRLLATSREILHLTAEVRVHVRPLPLPEDAAGAVDSPAVELFVARARAARPGFQLTAEAGPFAAEIVRRLDGLPLAIELAAARVNVLGLSEILSVVERRLALLRDRPESDPSRAGLRGLVEWSYDLLHADEKTLLEQLAVHRGGASLQSLAAAGAARGLDEPTVTFLLEALVDRSIVSASFPGDEARYGLLDTVREYVLEQLDGTGGLAPTRRAHAEFFARLAAEAAAELRGPRWLAWTRRLTLDADNLWGALEYAREARDASIAGRLGEAAWYFVLAERVSEGRRFVEGALDVLGREAPRDVRVELLAWLCYLACEEVDLEAALATGEQALALGGDLPAVSLVRAALALSLARAGDGERAAAVADEARVGFEAVGDEWGTSAACVIRAMIAAGAGDVATVEKLVPEILGHAEAIGFDAFHAPALLLGAWAAERRDDGAGAGEAYRTALEVSTRVGFADHAAFALAGLGANVLASGDLRQAEELERQALAAAEGASSPYVAAVARLELGRVLAAAGDAETAERLYRSVLRWSETPRAHNARESLFVVLAGSLEEAARAALSQLPALAPA
ncbi:MAG TPA: BTAD domain-containing putative transcriptional regulator [Gaiellaceae bacterium]|nr:BTAD domain-containing putative transcriptional regulator [Gaiellaceae bacterium]